MVPVLPQQHSLRNQNQTEHKYQLLDSDTTKYLRWTCRSGRGCGGLGDRLNGILQTFLVAFCTDRVFLLDDYHGSDLLVKTPQHSVARGSPATRRHAIERPGRSQSHVAAGSRQSAVRRILRRRGLADQPVDGVAERGLQVLAGTLVHASARDFYRTAFGALFALPPELLQATTQLQERAGLTLREAGGKGQRAAPWYYYIAMHVRTGLVAGEFGRGEV